jgi:hypothetical protein
MALFSKILPLFLSLLILSNCAFKEKKKQVVNSENKTCQTLLDELPQYKEEKALDKMSRAGKTGLHYLAVGTGAIADVVVIFSAGVAIGVTACSPFLIADSLNGGHSNATSSCVNTFLNQANFPELYDMPITTYVDGKTYKLTCPNLKVFESKLQEVLECRDSSLSAHEINWQVQKILKDKTLKKCIPHVTASTS